MSNRRDQTNPLLIAAGLLAGYAIVRALTGPSRSAARRTAPRSPSATANGAQLALAAPASDRREWVVMYSGHGSAFRYDGADPHNPPPPPYLTLGEAKEAAAHWELHADTIGGRAVIKNIRTGESSSDF